MSSVAPNSSSEGQQSIGQFQTSPITHAASDFKPSEHEKNIPITELDGGSEATVATPSLTTSETAGIFGVPSMEFANIELPSALSSGSQQERHTQEEDQLKEEQQVEGEQQAKEEQQAQEEQQALEEHQAQQTDQADQAQQAQQVQQEHQVQQVQEQQPSLLAAAPNSLTDTAVDRNTYDTALNVNLNTSLNPSFESIAAPAIKTETVVADTATNMDIDEMNKLQPDGIPLNQPTQSEINNILADFPESMLADRAKSIKLEDETETVHLHQSPNDSLIKSSKSFDMANTPSHTNHLTSTNLVDDKMNDNVPEETQKIQAYAMLDFDSFTFYVQTMQILLGRMVEGDSSTDALDIHLGNQKAISRRHAKIFYNFGNQRFELSVLGRNGAFVDGIFVEKGMTVPLTDGTKIQIGETEFAFVLPNKEKDLERSNEIQNDIVNENTDADKTKQISYVKDASEPVTDYQMEHLDSLVANFDEIKNDIQNNKILLSKDPKVLDIVFDPDNERRELEIEKEIGKVLAREHSQQADEKHEIDTDKKETAKSKKKSNTNSKAKSKSGDNSAGDAEKTSKPKTKPKRQPKAKKKVYTIDEIPEEYRSKPNLPYSILITDCLRKKGTERGMSLSEIYKGIQELFPYYFYCPDGWQSSVRHNLSLNKSFRKISKEGKGWLWGVNEDVIAEKDRARQKQLENAKAKGKPLPKPVPKSLSNFNMQSNSNIIATTTAVNQNASQINSNPVFQTNSKLNSQSTGAIKTTMATNATSMTLSQTTTQTGATESEITTSNTTAKTATASNKQSAKATSNNANNSVNMSANTKKALAYLQKELISLTKSRKMYDRATSTEILTKALAMTISQVDQAAKNFSIKGFPLVTLIDKNPGHVTKILTAALNAATLQICKQKGLTPHLPPKNSPSSTSASSSSPISSSTVASNSSKNSEIQMKINSTGSQQTISSSVGGIKTQQQQYQISNKSSKTLTTSKEEYESPSHLPQKSSAPIQHIKKENLENLSNNLVINSKKSDGPELKDINHANVSANSGPIVYQFSKAGSKPPFKGSAPLKPSFKPPIKSNTGNSNMLNNLKPIKLSVSSGTGLMKPQFYAKGKSPLIDNSKFSVNSNIKDETNNDDSIRQSIAKFGKPTAISITTNTSTSAKFSNVANSAAKPTSASDSADESLKSENYDPVPSKKNDATAVQTEKELELPLQINTHAPSVKNSHLAQTSTTVASVSSFTPDTNEFGITNEKIARKDPTQEKIQEHEHQHENSIENAVEKTEREIDEKEQPEGKVEDTELTTDMEKVGSVSKIEREKEKENKEEEDEEEDEDDEDNDELNKMFANLEKADDDDDDEDEDENDEDEDDNDDDGDDKSDQKLKERNGDSMNDTKDIGDEVELAATREGVLGNSNNNLMEAVQDSDHRKRSISVVDEESSPNNDKRAKIE